MTKKNQMYFAANPDAKHDEHLVDYHIDDIDLKFTTDAGVFSKFRVDYGSGVLIKAMKNVDFPKDGKKVVDQILVDAKDHLVENGVLLVVIQKKQGAPSAKKLMTKIYGNCEILARDKGYYILMSTNN